MPMIYLPQFVYFVRMLTVIKINDAANIKYMNKKDIVSKFRVYCVALKRGYKWPFRVCVSGINFEYRSLRKIKHITIQW